MLEYRQPNDDTSVVCFVCVKSAGLYFGKRLHIFLIYSFLKRSGGKT